MEPTQIFHLLQTYLEMGLLLASGFGGFSLILWIPFKLRKKPNYSHFVWTGYLLLVASIGLPLVFLALPRSTLFRPSAQVWSGKASHQTPRLRQILPILRA